LGWSKFVSAYVERDKKIFRFLVFCSYPPALLIDFEPRIALINAAKMGIFVDHRGHRNSGCQGYFFLTSDEDFVIIVFTTT